MITVLYATDLFYGIRLIFINNEFEMVRKFIHSQNTTYLMTEIQTIVLF